jgi:hypothetical protein
MRRGHSQRPSFEEAKRRFPGRFTMEHAPRWARCSGPVILSGGTVRYYAPQYRTDREWYDGTKFPGERDCVSEDHCFSFLPSWPLGRWLEAPYAARATLGAEENEHLIAAQ